MLSVSFSRLEFDVGRFYWIENWLRIISLAVLIWNVQRKLSKKNQKKLEKFSDFLDHLESLLNAEGLAANFSQSFKFWTISLDSTPPLLYSN